MLNPYRPPASDAAPPSRADRLSLTEMVVLVSIVTSSLSIFVGSGVFAFIPITCGGLALGYRKTEPSLARTLRYATLACMVVGVPLLIWFRAAAY